MENCLNYKKDETVYLPSDDGCYSIRKFDWSRIKRKAKNADQKESIDFRLIYSILFGVAGSAGVSLIPIVYANDLPVWVTPLYIIVTVFSAGVGFILVYMDSKTEKNKSIDFSEIMTEMEEVEQMFITQNSAQNSGVNSQTESANLIISKAIYGTSEKNKDISHELTKLIKNNSISTKITNAIAGGDPHPNKKKQLTVEYVLNGQSASITIPENGTLEIG